MKKMPQIYLNQKKIIKDIFIIKIRIIIIILVKKIIQLLIIQIIIQKIKLLIKI